MAVGIFWLLLSLLMEHIDMVSTLNMPRDFYGKNKTSHEIYGDWNEHV